MASQLRRASSGPFTPRSAIATAKAKAVICAQLTLRFRRFGIEASKAHLVHVSTLAGPGSHPYPASYPKGPTEESAIAFRFPAAFRRTGIRFLDHLVPTGELGLPHGRLTGHHRYPDPSRGCHVPHA